MVFATIRKDVVDLFVSGIDELKGRLVDEDAPRYDDKALTLFLLLRFRAGCDFEFHTSEAALCDLMGLSNRKENRQSIMSNLKQMQDDGLITMRVSNDKKFFWIFLQYDMFMPKTDYVIIYKKEFDELFDMRSRDKLFLLLYYIKKYQHKKTGITFPSVDLLARETKLSRATICQGIEKLNGKVLDVYRAVIEFTNGSIKEINYYKSLCDKQITDKEVSAIAKEYYKNIKLIKRKE